MQQDRADYGLSATYPLTAPNYSERRREMATAMNLGRKQADRPGGRRGAATNKGSRKSRSAGNG
jgi:predicted transcriptional regulator